MKPKNPAKATTSDNTRTITRNSFWYGLELFFGLAAGTLTSIAVARVMGPVALAPYQYLVLMTSVTISVGSFGLPITARKYMAEFLNLGQPGVVRAIYLATLRIQICIALGLTAIGLGLVFWNYRPGQLAIPVLLVLGMAPRLIATIPSLANAAREELRANTGPSFFGGVVSTALTLISVLVGWDLVGVSAAVIVGAVIECTFKLISVHKWLGHFPREKLPANLKRRMFAYSGQGIALLLLNVVVWDRSDVWFLKNMNADLRQVTFFSLSFNLTEKILLIPASFVGSLTTTIMAQPGRANARLKEITADGARYSLLVALPLLLGLAALSPTIVTVYGNKYLPMIPTLVIVSLLAIPKALVVLPTGYLQATERQGFLIAWGCFCGAIDIALDILLVPAHGSKGAAAANGIAQTLAALGIFLYVWRIDRLEIKILDFVRIIASGAIMVAGVLCVAHFVPGAVGMFAAIGVGAAVWMVCLRLTRALRPQDVSRFTAAGSHLPGVIRPFWRKLMDWLAPPLPAL